MTTSGFVTPSTSAPPAAQPFVKWAGGKRKLVPRILALLPERCRTYREPFVGGGAVFYATRAEGRAERHVLADVSHELVATYRAVRDQPDRLVAALRRHEQAHAAAPDPRAYYDDVRASQLSSLYTSDVDLAAWLVFLNKTCFNGLWRVNKKGQFNVPYGQKKSGATYVCDEAGIRACSRALSGAEIVCMDFQPALDAAGEGDAVYLDPPYWPLSRDSSFRAYAEAGFSADDQRRLRDAAVRAVWRGAHVVASNSSAPEAVALWRDAPGFRVEEVRAARSINARGDGRGEVSEILAVGGSFDWSSG